MRAIFCATALLFSVSNTDAAECANGSADVLKLVSWTTKERSALFGPVIDVTMTLENITDISIRMIDGSIELWDALGAHIGLQTIDRDFRVDPYGRSEATFSSSGLSRLQRLEIRDVVAIVCVRTILSEDGSQQQFSPPPQEVGSGGNNDPAAFSKDGVSEIFSRAIGRTNVERMTLAELKSLRQQIQGCWNPPIGARDPDELVVRVQMLLNQDGSVEAIPDIEARGVGPFYDAAADSARRAVLRCQPYVLPVEKYEFWREVRVTFDPRELF